MRRKIKFHRPVLLTRTVLSSGLLKALTQKTLRTAFIGLFANVTTCN